MSTTDQTGTPEGVGIGLTRERVKLLPRAPFLSRKHAFDACLGEILDQAANERSRTVILGYLGSRGNPRKKVLGDWFDHYVVLTAEWAEVAVIYDKEHRKAKLERQRELEDEYLGFEKAKIRVMLDSVDTFITCVDARTTKCIRERIKEVRSIWCERTATGRINGVMRLVV